MSKCPFWSIGKMKVECYSECPMHPSTLEEEICPFKEHLSSNKIDFRDIIDDEFAYSKDNILEYGYVEESARF